MHLAQGGSICRVYPQLVRVARADLMKLADGKGTYVIYLDVWKREENSQDDANVRETAQEDTNIGKRSGNSGKPANKGRRVAEKK